MVMLKRQLLWCAMAAGFPPLLAFIFAGGRISSGRLGSMFLMSLIFACCIAIPLETFLHAVTPRLRHKSNWVTIPFLWLSLTAFACFGTFIGSAIICGVGLLPWRTYGQLFHDALLVSLLLTYLFGVGGWITGSLNQRLDETNRLLRQKEEDERKAQALATESRLLSLESRVHPHFLFNAINSILSLIRDDPRRAEDLLERMAGLLRYSLEQTQGRLVPLSAELRVVRDYLEIEHARFGDRLRYSVDEAPGLTADLPPLSVQTLVENSVKYAISPRREGGAIRVRTRAVEGDIIVEVSDDGPGFGEEDIGKGQGLALVRDRLAGLGAFELERTASGMTARIRLPQPVRA
jgi:signal transduction histidine kinase